MSGFGTPRLLQLSIFTQVVFTCGKLGWRYLPGITATFVFSSCNLSYIAWEIKPWRWRQLYSFEWTRVECYVLSRIIVCRNIYLLNIAALHHITVFTFLPFSILLSAPGAKIYIYMHTRVHFCCPAEAVCSVKVVNLLQVTLAGLRHFRMWSTKLLGSFRVLQHQTSMRKRYRTLSFLKLNFCIH